MSLSQGPKPVTTHHCQDQAEPFASHPEFPQPPDTGIRSWQHDLVSPGLRCPAECVCVCVFNTTVFLMDLKWILCLQNLHRKFKTLKNEIKTLHPPKFLFYKTNNQTVLVWAMYFKRLKYKYFIILLSEKGSPSKVSRYKQFLLLSQHDGLVLCELGKLWGIHSKCMMDKLVLFTGLYHSTSAMQKNLSKCTGTGKNNTFVLQTVGILDHLQSLQTIAEQLTK